jgi:hypothetical protein
MDENSVDDVSYQEDGSAPDEVTQFEDQYTRILNTTGHLESLSAFFDYGARIGDLPSSPARSPLHLASLSSEPLRSPHTDGIPTTVVDGPGISSWYFFAPLPKEDCSGSVGECCISEAHRRTGICIFASLDSCFIWLTHINSCFIDSRFARE